MKRWPTAVSSGLGAPLFVFGLLVTLGSATGRQLHAQPASRTAEPAINAKSWLEKRGDYERFLKDAKVVGMKQVPVGVTKPMRCQLEAGGPVAEMAWKAIQPGRYSGYFESYKNEIAAYELDKKLQLDMVPPTVEKRVNQILGAAVMWVSPTQSFKQLGGAPAAPAPHAASWNRQLSRAKMFDNLIANIDPNLGNWLVDPAWNLMLIDHTRAFTTTNRLVHQMQRIDTALWAEMQALTEESLEETIGQWIGTAEIRAVLKRRDRMREEIDLMVRKRSEAAVFLR